MDDFGLPEYLSDKIYEIKKDREKISQLVSYFPLSKDEQKEIQNHLGELFSGNFHSIFSDIISDKEWQRTKTQIKKRFQDDLFHIDQN